MINVGGEDVVALGSDFDGIHAPAGLEDCTKVQKFLTYLSERGISSRICEKIAYKNALKVFTEFLP